MKRLKTLCVILIGLTISIPKAYAIRTLVVERTVTGCTPGCGSTSRTTELITYETPSGRQFIVNEVTIGCSGIGFKTCPANVIAPSDPLPHPYDNIQADILLNTAYIAVANGTLSGTASQTVVNTVTNETFLFEVEWNVVLNADGTQQSSYKVYKTWI